jgi:hypothetical protein
MVNLVRERQMAALIMKRLHRLAVTAVRLSGASVSGLAAALLAAGVLGLLPQYAGAQSQALQNSPATDAAGDQHLHFWAVNEGGARIYKPDAAACARIRGLSAQYAEAISVKYRVPAYTLKLMTVLPPDGLAGCELLVDTPDGAKQCRLGSVIKTFGGSYLAHTYAQADDGSVRYVAGACRPGQ